MWDGEEWIFITEWREKLKQKAIPQMSNTPPAPANMTLRCKRI